MLKIKIVQKDTPCIINNFSFFFACSAPTPCGEEPVIQRRRRKGLFALRKALFLILKELNEQEYNNAF